MLKEAVLQEWKEARRLKETVEREQQNVLNHHESFVGQHMGTVRFICRRVDTAEKIAAAVEEHLQAVFAR